MSATDTHRTAMGQKLPNLADLNVGEELMDRFAERYRADPELRERCAAGGAAPALSEFGMKTPGGADARIVESTDEITYVVFPGDPNAALSDDMLSSVSGGSGGGATCVSSAGTVGTVPSTVFSLGSAGTVCPD